MDLLKDSNFNYNLIFIKSNFRALINVILRFEEWSSPLSASITIVLDTQNEIEQAQNKNW